MPHPDDPSAATSASATAAGQASPPSNAQAHAPFAAPVSPPAAESASRPPATPASPPVTAPRPATFFQVAGAVFWSFFGVRKGRHMQQDTLTIKPAHVVVVGLLAGLVFVLALIALVTFITRNAV